MRNRGSIILVKEGKLALIKRVKNGHTYYVFLGGGIEAGETPQQTAKREAFEELGILIQVHECFTQVEYQGSQFFYV